MPVRYVHVCTINMSYNFLPLIITLQDQSQKFSKVGHAEARDRIPSNSSIYIFVSGKHKSLDLLLTPVRTRNNSGAGYRCASLGVVAVAAIRLTRRDICEALITTEIDERVQEAKNWHAGTETSVIEQRNDRGSDRRSCRCSARRGDLATLENRVAGLR